MPKKVVPLSDVKIRNSKPHGRDYKITDGGGLYLLVTRTGSKLWRFKYHYDDKEKLISLGAYPVVPLSDARQKRDEAKSLLDKGVNPSASRKESKLIRSTEAANSFANIAREWHKHKTPEWSADHAKTILARLEKDILPWLADKPLADISARDIKSVVDRVRSRGTVEAARRLLTIIGQVLNYSIMTDRINYNVTQGLRGYLPPTSKTRTHMPAITDQKEFAGLLLSIDSYRGSFPTQCALKLLPLFFCRPGELRKLEWSEINFEAKQITIPANKMKMREDHIIPLSIQAITILKDLQPLTGCGKFIFPSILSVARPMSDNALNSALRRMGFDHDTVVAHGFRASARTLLHETLKFDPHVIEAQLAHRVPDALGTAYNRTTHLPERTRMMQAWADFLDKIKTDGAAKIVPFRTGTDG